MSGAFEHATDAVDDALPDGWIIRSMVHDGMTWTATATPYGALTGVTGMGDTVIDALDNLAKTLRERAS